MSDIKLFNIAKNKITQLEGKSVSVEKSLQTLIENHLEDFLGINFLATEYSTGVKQGGRIDTLGIDENKCLILSDLFYSLFVLFRPLCPIKSILLIADYTKYDSYAVQQINRNIELIRYKKYTEHILFELVNAVSGETPSPAKKKVKYATVNELLEKSSEEIKNSFESLKTFIFSLGADIQLKGLKFYYAFKKIRNFVTVEIHPQNNTIALFIRLEPKTIKLVNGFTRDVTNIGHWGTGNLEVTIKSTEDFELSKPYIIKSYELN